MTEPIPTRIVPSIEPAHESSAKVSRDFRKLIDSGVPLKVDGEANGQPTSLLSLGYTPKHRLSLFGTDFYLANVRQNPALRFFVAYVVQRSSKTGRLGAYARIFYKDLSLVWRSASHLIATNGDFWIGKGDVRTVVRDGFEQTECVESTTDLPLEMQTALETLNRKLRRPTHDEEALFLVLRDSPSSRVSAYRDFTEPRKRAASNKRNLIHGGRSIARFKRRNDPSSLVVVSGFEPDFKNGVLERGESKSTMYGGRLWRYRILSRNKKIQYLFMAGARHVWIIPPQAMTTELSTYGVRTVDVVADDDLFVPGFEYHYFDENADESEHFSQIPEGFAGPPSDRDPDRADASAWLDRIPMIREFRASLRTP